MVGQTLRPSIIWTKVFFEKSSTKCDPNNSEEESEWESEVFGQSLSKRHTVLDLVV